MISLAEFRAAEDIVYRHLDPTPQIAWPLLRQETGIDVVVKHENHQRTGAFKVRGGLVHLARLKAESPTLPGIVSATRGNHGQSLGNAAGIHGIACTILVPRGNSAEKNAAMRALGVELIEHGRDFDEAKARAIALAAERGLTMVPSFHRDLVAGVGTYGLELMRAEPDLEAIFCPIGLGSGICGLIAAKAALGHRAKIIGVVSDRADAYARSLEAGRVMETDSALTFADGMAVRGPSPEAFAMIAAGVERIVRVSDDAIAEAMRMLFRTTHNVAEGAGAAALAALLAERDLWQGQRIAVILSGGNIDQNWYAGILAGQTPQPR